MQLYEQDIFGFSQSQAHNVKMCVCFYNSFSYKHRLTREIFKHIRFPRELIIEGPLSSPDLDTTSKGHYRVLIWIQSERATIESWPESNQKGSLLSPNLNPIGNLWPILIMKLFEGENQYNSKTDVWKAIKTTMSEFVKIKKNKINGK